MKTGKLTPQLTTNVKANTWVKAYEHNTTGSAETSITISGLAGDTDKEYLLEGRLVAVTSCDIVMQFNGDTGANYGRQLLRANNTTLVASRVTGSTSQYLVGATNANDVLQFKILISAASGYIRTSLQNSFDCTGTTVNYLPYNGGVWNNTADELTSITIFDSGSQPYIGIGSNFILWKKVAL